MNHCLAVWVAVVLAGGTTACGPETTSFRTTDRSDSNHAGPPSAAYDVFLGGRLAARAHVWSSGGYMSSTGEPMTHVGFEINSATMRPLLFDGDALELVVFDDAGATLPLTRFTSITPLGPSLITVPAASTVMLGTYFLLPVQPRKVGSMQVRWTVRLDAEEYHQVTGFIRDDDAQIIEHVPARDLRFPSS
jgi:hypothetical protein